jgi:hypothetical protein
MMVHQPAAGTNSVQRALIAGRLEGVQTRWASALVVAVLASGCGAGPVVPTVQAGVTATSSSAVGAAATRAGNERAARQEAARLAALASVPPGSVATSQRPPILGSASVRSTATSVVDVARFWQVPLPYPEASAWIAAHPPRGLPAAGDRFSGSGPQGLSAGYGFSDPATSPSWEQASLQFAVTPDGAGGSVLRVDALVTWVDPIPLPDSAAGPRLRVRVAGPCPSGDRGVVGVLPAARLDRQLLPDGEPSGGLVCRYAGSDAPGATSPLGLSGTARLDRPAAQRLAAAIRAVRLAHVPGEVWHCPADAGSVAIIALAFPGRDDVDLWYTPGGCGGLSNGTILAFRPAPLPIPGT